MAPNNSAVRYSRDDLDAKHGNWRFSGQISITSQTGVGGSTLLANIQKRLPVAYRYLSVGGLFRIEADRRRMRVEELGPFLEKHPEIRFDEKCDSEVAIFAKQNWMVCESRLSHLFMPHSFRVVLTCNPMTRAYRRLKDRKKKEPGITLEKVLEDIESRDAKDARRYDKFYPGWDWDPDDFDYPIDTDSNSEEQTCEKVCAAHCAWIENGSYGPVVRTVEYSDTGLMFEPDHSLELTDSSPC